MEEKIMIMQNNLVYIRKYLNISAKELGDKLGVTRQTINNIENGRNKLSKTQYLAILYVLENDILPTTIDVDSNIIHKLLNKKVIKTITEYDFKED